MWSNFHTHSHYCDGKGALRDYLAVAVKSGVKYLGFSSHAPISGDCPWCLKAADLPDYLAEIESLRADFPQVELYKGLEIDYVPGSIAPKDFADQLDYTVGSIHFVDAFKGKRWEIDSTSDVFRTGLSEIFGNDIRKAVGRYYALTREMIRQSPPDILGHLDKIKMNAEHIFFDETEPWYRDQIDETLNTIVTSGTIVEVNTRGLYKKKTATPYPSPWILERISDAGIPVMLNSDAHHPEDLTREFELTLSLLKDTGFKQLSVLCGGHWREIPIEAYGGSL